MRYWTLNLEANQAARTTEPELCFTVSFHSENVEKTKDTCQLKTLDEPEKAQAQDGCFGRESQGYGVRAKENFTMDRMSQGRLDRPVFLGRKEIGCKAKK
jgi:hypothetical protein